MPRSYPLHGWVIGIITGAIALAALIVGSAFGNVHAATFNPKLIAWVSAAVLVASGVVATSRLSTALSRLLARQYGQALEGTVKFTAAAVGYLFVVLSALTVLDVSIEHLLVGAGLAGVVLGIAAQQSLGNIFAGVVLIMARPFGVGDHIRIRSGALGGIFDAWVLEMSLTYVTVRTDDGKLKIPNTAMLAAGVGQVPEEAERPKPAGGEAAKAAATTTDLATTDGSQTVGGQTGAVQTVGAQTGLGQTGAGQTGPRPASAVQTTPGTPEAASSGRGDDNLTDADPARTAPTKRRRPRKSRSRTKRTNEAETDPMPPPPDQGGPPTGVSFGPSQ